MTDSECQGLLSFLKQILVLPCGDRTFFYTGYTYLCNSQAHLCDTECFCRRYAHSVCRWLVKCWQKYPGLLGNRDCSRRHGPVLFRSCSPGKAVSITQAGRLSPSPAIPGWHFLALNYPRLSGIRLEIKIYLRWIRKDARGGCPGRRTLPCPHQQGRYVADVKGH